VNLYAPLQRGRAPKSAEMSLDQPCAQLHRWLQRGRAPKSAEMTTWGGTSQGWRTASTGPRSEERGDCTASKTRNAEPGCFNGAALRRARRFRFPAHGTHASRPASTGPRSEERGDVSQNGMTPYATASFNGAALRRARRSWERSRRRWHRRPASTGPRSEERGDVPFRGTPEGVREASTGPRSEERGDAAASSGGMNDGVQLQRGRAPKSAEIHPT